MIKKIILGGGAVMFGCLVVLMSLLNTKTRFTDSALTHSTSKEFYLADQIYPDHILYPVTAAFDRLQLGLATNTKDKAMLRVNFSRERLLSAEILLGKDKPELAMQTLSKAHQYWLLAADDAIGNSNNVDQLAIDYVRRYSLFMDKELSTLALQLPDADQQKINVMREQQRVLREQL